MPPRNLLVSIALGALATLAHPFAFAARAAAAAGSSLGRGARRLAGSRPAKPEAARWTPELLKRLEWRRFEELCAAYFEAQGADGAGVLVQCRPWSAHGVGARPVRELRGAMASGNVEHGVLFTSGKFTREARDLAGKEGVRLIDGADLVAGIAGLAPEKAFALYELATRGDFQTPTCPSCGIKMVARKSTAHGRPYWGCRHYPACKQTFFEAA